MVRVFSVCAHHIFVLISFPIMVRVFSVCAHHIFVLTSFSHYGARIFSLRAPYLRFDLFSPLWCAYFQFARTICSFGPLFPIMVRVFSVCAHHIFVLTSFSHFGARIFNLRAPYHIYSFNMLN